MQKQPLPLQPQLPMLDLEHAAQRLYRTAQGILATEPEVITIASFFEFKDLHQDIAGIITSDWERKTATHIVDYFEIYSNNPCVSYIAESPPEQKSSLALFINSLSLLHYLRGMKPSSLNIAIGDAKDIAHEFLQKALG